MSDSKHWIRFRFMMLALLAVLVVSACAPDDLDITPTTTPTSVPTATPSPTPEPEGFEAELILADEQLAIIIDNLPARIPAGAVEWRRDLKRGTDGIDPLLNVTNGTGSKVYYSEQTGGQMNLAFAVFDTPEDALANYERIKAIRSVLLNGKSDESLPMPNIFGSGLYGSVALFQIENYFIEVSIESFSSTQTNPLVSLARATVRYFDEIKPQLDSAGS
jgi:hypothetical protein